ncbi:MAG: tetratricopeptide repeat protein [Candidatus Aminicenantes bacterium]|nr:MAG: tetratricopeptide repeat protein [Candidatus Aminicenantes bacterium]
MIRYKDFSPKKLILLSALLLILFSSLVFSQDWRGRGRISGFVLTEDGKPIPNVKVVFEFARYGAKFERFTDKKGKWVAANVRGGQWNIDFYAEGYEPKQISTSVSEVLRSKPIEIRLKRTEKSIVSEKVSELLVKGNELFNQKNYQEAIEEYQNILKENPEIYIINKNVGNSYYEMGDYDSAIKYYKKVLEKEPGSKEILIALGNTYLEKGDLEKGLSYFKQIDEEAITNPLTFYNFGTSFFNKGEINKAIEYYNKAITLDPNLTDAYYQLGLCYLNTNEKEKAKENFNKFLELAPDSDKAAAVREMLKHLRSSIS